MYLNPLLPIAPFDTYTWSTQSTFWRPYTFIVLGKSLGNFSCINFDKIRTSLTWIPARKSVKVS